MMPVADLIALPYIARETYCHCIAHKTFHCSSGVPWSPTNYKCIATIIIPRIARYYTDQLQNSKDNVLVNVYQFINALYISIAQAQSLLPCSGAP